MTHEMGIPPELVAEGVFTKTMKSRSLHTGIQWKPFELEHAFTSLLESMQKYLKRWIKRKAAVCAECKNALTEHACRLLAECGTTRSSCPQNHDFAVKIPATKTTLRI